LDLISTTSGNTFNKAISNSYNLYTAMKNDTVTIDYGDSTQQVIQLNSGKNFIFDSYRYLKIFLYSLIKKS